MAERPPTDDAAKALRLMAVKAAIFIGIPLIAALVAALAILFRQRWWLLRCGHHTQSRSRATRNPSVLFL